MTLYYGSYGACIFISIGQLFIQNQFKNDIMECNSKKIFVTVFFTLKENVILGGLDIF